jgi:farnesyl-diphosphate farnesyltransferase
MRLSIMVHPSHNLVGRLLRDVSRSFYLTMRVLPGRIRPQIGLAYLLARTTDTVADTAILPVELRLNTLRQLRDRILGLHPSPVELTMLSRSQGTAPERELLERVEEALEVLARFSEADRRMIREVISVIVSGQELDLTRFATASRHEVVALKTEEEFDDYTYRVAGCVGEFWTRICRTHLFPTQDRDDDWFLHNGVRFGKGLQSVNILRDLASDLRLGRCYLPEESLERVGLSPADLLIPENEGRLRPIYRAFLDQAHVQLSAGWDYTLALPRGQARVRLACAWPILIGVRTLSKLRTDKVLSPEWRVKVSRRELRRLILQSVVLYPWPAAWRRLFDQSSPEPHAPYLG